MTLLDGALSVNNDSIVFQSIATSNEVKQQPHASLKLRFRASYVKTAVFQLDWPKTSKVHKN